MLSTIVIAILALVGFGGPISVMCYVFWRTTDKVVYAGPALVLAGEMNPRYSNDFVAVSFDKPVAGESVLVFQVSEETTRLVARERAVKVMVLVKKLKFCQPRITSLTIGQPPIV